MPAQYLDAIVVGAGIAGLGCLHELRKFGFSCKVFEAGSGLGGVWYWNSYPGARVDTEFFLYQFLQPEIGRGFEWSERFPGAAEIQKYLSYVDERHNFSRDILFNTLVKAATFNSSSNLWEVTTSDLAVTKCRYFILCTGCESKTYRPKYPGLNSFRGECYHTGNWPRDRKVDFKKKRVGVIGTGASGVQVIQEVGPVVEHLTVFQRTPNLATPIGQKSRNDDWYFPSPSECSQIQDAALDSFAGVGIDFVERKCVDATPEEREAFYEQLYARGGFGFWLGTYVDTLLSLEANEPAYKFWQKKAASRIQDPVKRELLAPLIAPHPFGTKRPCLERAYFEVFNQPNVDLVNVRTNPILEVTNRAIRLQNKDEVELDMIIFATGYDAVSGTILAIDIQNESGNTIQEYWKDGIKTFLGMTIEGFPNLFFTYGPHSPSDLGNGPTVSKIQVDWIAELLVWLRKAGKQRVEAKVLETEKWVAKVHECYAKTLFPLADSWFHGCNIPGKKKEPLCYSGGISAYVSALRQVSGDDYVALNVS